jgi:hypothetical protein
MLGTSAAFAGIGALMAFQVLVDDNFHPYNEGERYRKGVYDTLGDAIAVCRGIVDRDLADQYEPGMTADELYRRYTSLGAGPFIRDTEHAGIASEEPPFSAGRYAQQQSKEICLAALRIDELRKRLRLNLARKSAGDTREQLNARGAVFDWIATNHVDASNLAPDEVDDRITRLQSEYRELAVQLSADLSRTGRPMYGISWVGQFHAFELSADQARELGIRIGTFAIQGIGGEPSRDTRYSTSRDVRLDRLRINDGSPHIYADVPITVAVTYDPFPRPSQYAQLRVGMVGLHSVLVPIDHLARSRELKAVLPPVADHGCLAGPVVLFVELVVGSPFDEGYTVASNTLTTLLDVAAPQPH